MAVVKPQTHKDMTSIMRFKENMFGVIKDFITLYLKKASPVVSLGGTEIEKKNTRERQQWLLLI